MQHDLESESPASKESSDRIKIESLKKEVDFYIRTDANRAMGLANAAYEIALATDDRLARALGLRAMALALHVTGSYENAITLYSQAKSIYDAEACGLESARVARSMADALMYLGRYEEALTQAGEARSAFVALAEPLLTAQADTNIGNIYHRMDRYQEALERYQSAMQVFREANDSTALAVSMFNAANIHSNRDDFREAEKLYQGSHDIYSAQGMTLAAAQSKYSLGYLHFLKGAYHPAMRALHEVLDEFRRLGDKRFVMLCGLDLAEIYLQLNLLEETVKLATEAHSAAQTLQLRYEAAKALSYLGLACMRQSKLTRAEHALLEAQRIFREEGNRIYEGLAGIYLAELEIQRHRPQEALQLARHAEILFEEQQLHTRRCYARLVLARAAALSGDAAKAREIGESLAAQTAANVDAPWIDYQAHELLGELFAGHDLSRAEFHYQKAAQSIERIRGGIRVDAFRSTFFKNKLPVYDRLIQLCLTQAGPDKEAQAFYYLESQKGRTLVDLLAGKPERTSERPDIAELRSRWQRLYEEIHWHNSKADHDERSGIRRFDGGTGSREQLDAREQSLEALARRMQVLDPDFVSLLGPPGLTVGELRAALRADEVVVEYYFQDEKLKIFMIDPNETRVEEGPNSRTEINALIVELKFHLEKMNYGRRHLAIHGARLLQGANDCLRRLYDALVEPVARFLGGRKIIFVPFDTLHHIPFPALFDGAAYLIDRHEIGIAPSARLFVSCAGRAARGYGKALVLGAADEAAPRICDEVQAIRERFPSAVCFTGAEATTAELKRLAPAADVIHIASHSVFRSDSPMFSALKLADGWVNCYDIASLRLSPALVTLSGCRTGSLGIHAGDELSGLVRAFLSAGAIALIVSLWSVSDSATAEMMNAFYRQLQSGLSPRAALRAASLAVREANPNPWHWAPFVFIGGH